MKLVRKPPKTKRSLPGGWHNWALGLLCLAVVTAAIASIGSSSSGAATEQRTAKAGRGVVQATVSGNGSLEAAKQVELSFGASGEVTDIYVEAGERVVEGETLARIDSSSARASLASAEAQLAEAEETLEAARETEVSTSFESGATTVLASYQVGSAEELGDEPAEEKPAPEGSAPEEPAGEQDPERAAPESPGGATPSAGGGESSAPAATVSVATAEANMRQAELNVESAEQEVSETALRAPFSGTVASISRSGGEGSSPFIVLTQLDRLKMEVSFSEADIGKVKVGQPATVSISSMEGTELAGRVTKVDVLPSEGSSGGVVEYPATILLTQRAKGLRAGMSASAEVVVEQVGDAVTVPNEAIASGPRKTVTVSADGREVQRTVETGLVGDETTEVLSGLKAGETVILPEASVPTGGMEAGGEGGLPSFRGGAGGLPSFGGGGPPGGFPGAP